MRSKTLCLNEIRNITFNDRRFGGSKMVVGAFPLVKLGFIFVKQISKPIANGIANRARKSKIFRNYVCIPIAQLFHIFDVKVKMRALNLGKVQNVKKLDEKNAIDTGAQASCIYFISLFLLSQII